jgi:hypothetical protein
MSGDNDDCELGRLYINGTVPIDSIRVGQRIRKEIGDVTGRAVRIGRLGLPRRRVRSGR